MKQRCLVIADDLTGAADTGAQFVKNGFNTLLVSPRDADSIDFSEFSERDVLVIATDSRALHPPEAFHLVSNLSRAIDRTLFPIIYKKIDSTLRGNIGQEVDAILYETGIPVCIAAPSYPEQHRTMVDGIMMVERKPIASSEFASALPVKTSDARNLLEKQSVYGVGRIALQHVRSGQDSLQKKIEAEQAKGHKIIIVDAVERQDLANIAETALKMSRTPLLVGSAGLAEEVAKRMSLSREDGSQISMQRESSREFKHIFIISGSLSPVTHKQLERGEEKWGFPSFELTKPLLTTDENGWNDQKGALTGQIVSALERGHAVLKTCPEVIATPNSPFPFNQHQIARRLADAVYAVMKAFRMHIQDFAMITIGGDTAMNVFSSLAFEGIEIEGELIEGIMMGHLVGGLCDGLEVITKAGAFGGEDALCNILDLLSVSFSSGGSSN